MAIIIYAISYLNYIEYIFHFGTSFQKNFLALVKYQMYIYFTLDLFLIPAVELSFSLLSNIKHISHFKFPKYIIILDVIKRNPLFLHEIEWKNNGFRFTTPNTIQPQKAI